jgi:hypothetical protein
MKEPTSLAGVVSDAFHLGSTAAALVRPLQELQHRASTDIERAMLHRLHRVLGDFSSQMLSHERTTPPAVRSVLMAAAPS